MKTNVKAMEQILTKVLTESLSESTEGTGGAEGTNLNSGRTLTLWFLVMASLTLFTERTAFAQVTAVDISTRDPQWVEPRVVNGEIVTGSGSGIKSREIKTLTALMGAEEKGDWTACAKHALEAHRQSKALAPWIFRVEMTCLLGKLGEKKPALLPIQSRLMQISNQTELFVKGAHVEPLKSKWKDAQLALLDVAVKNKSPKLNEFLEAFYVFRAWMTNAERARVLYWMGEQAFLKQNLEGAKALLQKSVSFEDTIDARSKLQMVESSMGAPRRADVESPNVVTDETPRERELGVRFLNSVAKGEVVPIMEDAMALLLEFPGGVKSRMATDKIYEAFSSLFDKDDPKFQSVRERVYGIIKKADAMKLSRWALSSYRNGNYSDSYFLSKEALAKTDPMIAPTKTIWIGARAAQTIGLTKEAKDLFQRIIDTQTGSEEYPSALIQLGLMALHENQWASAISYLERVLIKPRTSSVELVTRYWMWRALEKTDVPRAKQEAQILVQKFPLSYYGLRARAELAGGEIKYPFATDRPRDAKIWLSKSEKATFDRVITLYQAGWWEEAQFEFRDISDVPGEPIRRALLARISASLFDFPRAISQMNTLFDADPTLMQDAFLRAVYPKTFLPLINDEAQARKLDPLLVASLIRQESAYNPRAVSTSGAMGLMQMIPKTVQEVAGLLKVKPSDVDMFDPKTNVKFCTYYLGKMVTTFDGDVPLALAAYNAGPARLKKWLTAKGLAPQMTSSPLAELWIDELPWDETQFYVKAILRNLLLYRVLDRGRVQLSDPIWVTVLK